MAGTLGVIRGQMILDVKQAVAAYTAVRAANATTSYALRGASQSMLGVSKATGAVGLALAAGIGVAIVAAAKFEKQMDFFGAVTNSSAEDMDRARKKALQLGQDTVYSAGQIADSFVELGKAGVSADLIISGVGDAVAHLGAAADIPLTEAATIITAAVQSFSLSGKEAVHVADLLAGAANASIVDVQDLGVSLKYVGGVAAALGLPIEDVINALSLLGKYGIRGSTAGTSLRQIMVSLTGSSQKATAQLEELGIITKTGANLFFDAAGKAKPLAEIFQILQKHTEGLTQAQKVAAFKTIFNNRALAAALDLTKEGAKGFAAMNKEVGKTTAAEVSAKRLDNLAGDVEVLRGNIETLLITAGTPLQNFLRGIVQNVTKVIQAFTDLSPSTQQLILKIIAISAGLLLFMSAVTGVLGIMFRFADAVLRLAPAFKLLGSGIKIVATAMKALTIAMLTNPFVLIGLAVVALVVGLVLLYRHSERFRAIVKAVAKAAVNAFQATVAWFKKLPAFFDGVWESIKDTITGAVDAVVGFFQAHWPLLLAIMLGPLGLAVFAVIKWRDKIVGFFRAIPGVLGGYASAAVTAVSNFFKRLPFYIGYVIGFIAGVLVRGAIDWYNSMVNGAKAIYNGVVSFFSKLPGRLWGFITTVWHQQVALWTGIYHGIVNLAIAIYNGVVNWFKKLPGRVSSFVKSTQAKAEAAAERMRSRVVNLAQRLYTGVVSWFRQLPGKISDFLKSAQTSAERKFESMWTAAANFGKHVYESIKVWFEKIPGAVGDALQNAWQALKDKATGIKNAARDFGKGVWEGFKDGMGINSPSYIEKAMFQLTDVVEEESKKLKGQVKSVLKIGTGLSDANMIPKVNLAADYTASKASRDLATLRKVQASLQKASTDLTITKAVQVDQGSLQAASGSAAGQPIVTVNAPPAEFPKTVTLALEDGTEFSAYVKTKAGEVNDGQVRKAYAGRKN